MRVLMRVFDEATLKKKRVQNENLKSANKIFSTNNNFRPNDIYTRWCCKFLFHWKKVIFVSIGGSQEKYTVLTGNIRPHNILKRTGYFLMKTIYFRTWPCICRTRRYIFSPGPYNFSKTPYFLPGMYIFKGRIFCYIILF